VAACVGVVALVAVIVVVYIRNHKPDITRLTDTMLLEQTDFPQLPAGSWKREVERDFRSSEHQASSRSFSASVCGVFGWGYEGSREAGGTSWYLESGDSSRNWTYGVSVYVPPATAFDAAAMKRAFDSCGNYQTNIDGTVNTASIHRLELPDVPDWAVSYISVWDNTTGIGRHTQAEIAGVYRGVLITAYYGPVPGDSLDLDVGLKDALPAVFNTQVAKLEAA
jgi:hypothetical protein